MPDLRPLFSPDSIAIVGASADTHSLRGRTTQFLLAHGYPGRVYPITRSQPEVFGLKSYATVADLPEAPDLAVVVVPAAYVAPTLEECGRKGVRAAVVISSGFAEERGEAAQARDKALHEVIDRKHADDAFSRAWSSFDRFRKGELIGTRHDGTKVLAPHDGWIMFPDHKSLAGNEWFYLASPLESI